MRENDLCELILENVHLVTCFNCGGTLSSKMNRAKNNEVIAVLHIDPGESNYPHEPDISASAYFECVECANRGATSEPDETLEKTRDKNMNNLLRTQILSSIQLRGPKTWLSIYMDVDEPIQDTVKAALSQLVADGYIAAIYEPECHATVYHIRARAQQ